MKCVTEKEAYGMLTRMDKDELLNCMVFHMMEDGSELHCKVKDCPQISIGNMAAVPVIQLDVTDKKEIREIIYTSLLSNSQFNSMANKIYRKEIIKNNNIKYNYKIIKL